MSASLNGEARAYRTLLQRVASHLRDYFCGRFAAVGQGATESEDLLQEVLIAIHTRRHTYDARQAFTPWLHAIARYKFLDYLRRRRSGERASGPVQG